MTKRIYRCPPEIPGDHHIIYSILPISTYRAGKWVLAVCIGFTWSGYLVIELGWTR